MPLIHSLARKFAIPRRLDADDIEQELRIVIWNLTKRVDPDTQPDDFRRLLPVEMKNRCVDLTRFHKAQKRTARAGKGIQCKRCNTVTPWLRGTEAVCEGCGAEATPGKNNGSIRWIDLFVYDVSLGFADRHDEDMGSDEPDPSAISIALLANVGQPDPHALYLTTEAVNAVQAALPTHPESTLFNLYIDPPREFIQLLLEYGYAANPKKAPYWLLSSYLGDVSEKVLRMAFTRIGLSVAQATGRSDLIGRLSTYNLDQIGYSSTSPTPTGL